MEVAIPSSGLDFDFNSARSSPHVSPPSTPKRFGECYFSAPTSPSHLSQFYRDFHDLFVADSESASGGSASAVPFDWKEKPGTPKSPVKKSGDDFAFELMSEGWETASPSADELFDGGVIKPLKPHRRLQLPAAAGIGGHVTSPWRRPSAVSPSPFLQTRNITQGAFSPPNKNIRETNDPFMVTVQNANRVAAPAGSRRGRERGASMQKSSSRRSARSLSPLRDTQYPWEEEKAQPQNPSQSTVCSALSASVRGGHKKWRLKDFFLFRSASEGRAAEKHPLKKYTAALRRSSFRAIDGSGSGSGSRRRGPVSAHELHYTVNRAVSEDLKRKTFLPYKQGILGRLAFNPAVHALANGFGFSRK